MYHLLCLSDVPSANQPTVILISFYVHVTVHRNKFLFNKTNRRTNFPNLFCQETLHISGSSSTHHQEFSFIHSALVYVMQF
jgi:hypothetical protein